MQDLYAVCAFFCLEKPQREGNTDSPLMPSRVQCPVSLSGLSLCCCSVSLSRR